MKEIAGALGIGIDKLGAWANQNQKLSEILMGGLSGYAKGEKDMQLLQAKNAHDLELLDKARANTLADRALYSQSITGLAKPSGLVSSARQQPLTRTDGSRVFGDTGIINVSRG